MGKPSVPFNPGSFEGALTETFYTSNSERDSFRNEREKLVALLRTKHKEDEKAQSLADKLDACKKNRRCRSGACAECAHAAQRLFATTASQFVAKQKGPAKIVCVSVVPADGTCKIDNLSVKQAQVNVRRWKDRLGRAGVTSFIGGLDYSSNEHADARYEPHWSEHIYGLTTTTDVDGLKKKLREQFPVTDSIPRPVKVTPWDGDLKVLDYILKPNFWRRVATDNGKRFSNGKDQKRKCRVTDKQRLTSMQRVRLALYLDELGLHGRLILKRAQFVNHGATASIEKREPKGP